MSQVTRTFALIAFLLSAGYGAAAPAAEPDGQQAAAEPVAGENEAAKSLEPRRSPRRTLQTFVEGVHASVKRGETHRFAGAIACLDLSLIPEASRKEDGPLLAKTLYDVLARLWKIDWESVPDYAEGPAFRRVLARGGEEYGVLELVHSANEGWRFSPSFVADLLELRARTQHLPYLEGLDGAWDWRFWLEDRMPERLKRVRFLLPHWQWIGLLVVILLGLVCGQVTTHVSHAAFRRWVTATRVANVEEKLKKAERPFGQTVMALVWLLGLHAINLPIQTRVWLSFPAKLFAVFSVALAAYRAVDVISAYLSHLASKTNNEMDDLLVPLVRKTLKIFVAIFGLVFIAEQMGLNLTNVLLGLGIGGVAIALAAKDTVENLFGSFTVLLDRPFAMGDWVKIGDVEGIVEEVGFRSTRIRTFADSLVTVPNSRLVTAPIENFGSRRRRRIQTMLSVTYGTPPEKIEAFCEGIRELIRRHPYTFKQSYHVYFNAWNASSLDVLLYCFVETPDWATELREKNRLYLDILRLAGKLGISFAFPTQTLFIERPTASEPGAASSDLDAALRNGRDAAQALALRHQLPDGRRPEPVQFTETPEG